MSATKIDEDLYSRQLFVMGYAAQARMAQSDILIMGMRGLGVEIAKNIILMGVKSVTIWDPQPSTWSDLSAQFFLTEDDVTSGKTRADASVDKLRLLNQYVSVNVSRETEISEDAVKAHSVVVCTDQPLSEQLRINAICRKHNSKFVATESLGVFGRVFCDFGDSFRVDDINGENPISFMIAAVTNENPGVITGFEEMRHGLQDGDYITFSEVVGMEELNGSAPRAVKVINPYSFSIEDTTGYGKYASGGWAHQVKMPQDVTFKPMEAMIGPMESATGPSFGDLAVFDDSKLFYANALHLCFQELHAFAAANGSLPAINDVPVFDDIIAKVEARVGEKLDDGAKAYLKQFIRTSRGLVGPVCAALGGVAAQEVLKAVSGKFMPLKQWLYFDAVATLPYSSTDTVEVDCAPRGSRYDGQAAVFGHEFQQELLRLRYFLVGAGAIGCEILKNWAVMGVGAGAEGLVAVTDMDRIEKSNLSRQFLFRAEDIGNAKSTTAASAAKAMNPALNALAFEERVGPDTETLFDDAFWTGLNGVCTALDNVDARLYVDKRCVFYGKPLLESGTLGTKGNTQIVVPHLTENYGATRDPPEQGIPVCTLKNFPFKIEHTLQWARDWFEGEFKQIPDSANAYVTQPSFLEQLAKQPNSRLDTLEKIHDALVVSKPATIADCVRWARLRFEELFHNSVAQLLFNFPADSKTSNGEPFWSGAKRQPSPLVFDPADPTQMSFVFAAARLRALVFGIPWEADCTAEKLRKMAAEVSVPRFVPRSGVSIAANDKELEEQKKAQTTQATGWDVDSKAKDMEARLPLPADVGSYRLTTQDFEKDDDLHITLVTAVGNLRARNYRIEEVDKHTSKGIAGKIIPAIATTTALVSGLICLELYKIMANKPLTELRSCFVNLALPMFQAGEPLPPAKSTAILPPGATYPEDCPGKFKLMEDKSAVWEWTAWDHIDVDGPLTLKQFIEYVKTKFSATISMLCYTSAIIHSSFVPPPKLRERANVPLGILCEKISKRTIPAKAQYVILELSAMDAEGKQINLPTLRYKLGGPEVKESAGSS